MLASAASCPFCGVERAPSFEPEAPTVRASRGAALAFAAATLVAGCHTEPAPVVAADPAATAKPEPPKPVEPIPPPAPSPGEVDDHGGMVTKYGAPPPPTPTPKPTASASPSAKPITPPVAIYGGPPPPPGPSPAPKPKP